MLNKKSLLNRVLVGVVIAVVMAGMVALDIFLLNCDAYGTTQRFVSGRGINAGIISVLILCAVVEMRRAIGVEKIPDNFSWMLWVYGIFIGPSYILFGFTGIAFFTLLIFALSAITALQVNRADSLIHIAFVLVYPGLFMSALLYINKCASTQMITELSNPELFPYIEYDIWSVLSSSRSTQLLPYNALGLAFVFVVSSMTDVFAYFVGSIFGKHKLCPDISPKKTVEGAVGGLFGGLIGSVIIYFIFEYFHIFGVQYGFSVHGLSQFNTFLSYFLIGLIGSVMTQIGDLLASLVKRNCGVKDYSNILGDHGGIMDRCDGIMFNAVFVAVVYMFII